MPRRKDLQCTVWGLEYDFKERVGTLLAAPYQRCDMGACIALFEKIDPKVKTIFTVAGETPDVVYTRNVKSWNANRLVQPASVRSHLSRPAQRPTLRLSSKGK
jgi:hypothetical protein